MELSRQQSLEADIDLRMIGLFEFFEEFEDEIVREFVLRIARTAFGLGYVNAWKEERPASLFVDYGYVVPAREGAA